MSEKKSSPATTIVASIVGLGLMVFGWHASQKAASEDPGSFAPFKSISEAAHHMGITVDLGITIAVIGTFLLMFPIIKSFYVQPLEDAINERNSGLEKTFTEAENLRTEMTKMKSDYETRLADTETQARAQIQDEIKKAQDLRAQMQAEVATQREEMVKRAQEEINTERDRVIGQLRLHTVNLTMNATEKLIGTKMDADADRKLIEEFIEKAEVPVH